MKGERLRRRRYCSSPEDPVPRPVLPRSGAPRRRHTVAASRSAPMAGARSRSGSGEVDAFLLHRRGPEAQIHRFATRVGTQPRQLTAAPADSARSGVMHQTRRSTSSWMGNDKAKARGVAADGRRGRDPDSSNRTLPCVRTPPCGLRRSAEGGRGARPAGGEQGVVVPARWRRRKEQFDGGGARGWMEGGRRATIGLQTAGKFPGMRSWAGALLIFEPAQ
jgi:hypothetical protein